MMGRANFAEPHFRHALQFSPPCYSSKGLLLAKGTGFTLLRLQVVCEHSAGTGERSQKLLPSRIPFKWQHKSVRGEKED